MTCEASLISLLFRLRGINVWVPFERGVWFTPPVVILGFVPFFLILFLDMSIKAYGVGTAEVPFPNRVDQFIAKIREHINHTWFFISWVLD